MKPAVLFLFRGPQTDVRHEVGSRLERLSNDLTGLAIAPTYEEQEIKVGDFEIWSPAYRRRNGPLFQMRYLKAILARVRRWERLNEREIQLVVTSDPLRIGLLGWLISKFTGTRLVVEVNGDYGHSANYAEISSNLKRYLKRKIFVTLEGFILGRANGIKLLYPNQIEKLGVNLTNKVVASYFDFVDLTQFSNIEETRTVLLAGFPFKVKGVDILIAAFRRVSDQHPDWRLRIVGYYPDPSEIEAAIAGHPAMTHTKPIPHTEMPELMGRCGIYVSASRTEAMGRVLLEAMWCGKPRVASNVGGCWTLVDDDRDGFLFESGNVGQLAELLDRLMGDKGLRCKIGERARERAREEFSPQVYCQKTTEFYISVLG